MMTETRKVKYIGPRTKITFPGRSQKIVQRGEVIDVPITMRLSAHWRDVQDAEPEAPIKDGE